MEFPKPALEKESLKALPVTNEATLPQKMLKRDYFAVCSGESSHSLKSSKKLRSSDSESNIETLCAAIPKLREYFKVSRRIGCGTFSNVYLGSWRNISDDISNCKFALKHIFSSSHPDRVLSEVKCLKLFGGENYVVGMECCIRQNGENVLVLPYVKHDRFKKLLEKMSMVDVQEYIRQLLTALRHVHSHNIIHRDIKPNNFLYDIETKKGGLVDFGLAQYAPTPKEKTKNSSDVAAVGPKLRRNSTHVTSSNQLSLRPLSKRRCLSEIQNNVNIKAGLAAASFSSEKPLKKGIKGKSHSFSSNDDIMAKKRHKFSGRFMTTSPKVFSSDKISLSERHSPFSSLKIGDIFPSIRKYESSGKWKGGSSSSRTKDKCSCFDKLKVCRKCLARPHPSAPRAGTSGFRPPEVLLKHKEQTTAVDIWASGIILISILSGRCPFFPAIHDLESLAILMSVFGTKKIEDMAKSCGKHVNYSEHFEPVDLKGIVLKLRRASQTCDSKSSSPRRSPRHHWCTDNALPTHAPFLAEEIPDACFDLLFKLLDVNPFTRISADDALKHDFFNLQFSVLH